MTNIHKHVCLHCMPIALHYQTFSLVNYRRTVSWESRGHHRHQPSELRAATETRPRWLLRSTKQCKLLPPRSRENDIANIWNNILPTVSASFVTWPSARITRIWYDCVICTISIAFLINGANDVGPESSTLGIISAYRLKTCGEIQKQLCKLCKLLWKHSNAKCSTFSYFWNTPTLSVRILWCEWNQITVLRTNATEPKERNYIVIIKTVFITSILINNT